jgi:Tol biopolymer transport system component/tRNA A-37 threonylcarbamoyl transferase component Bud32
MPFSAGDKLGPYEILAPLGAGGMGEVYKARDPRLGRIIAIKVSQARFSERFEREARAVAALSHPNICHLYDVGPNYLVMEFFDGAPITAPDTARKLLDVAVQIADGMSAAHAVPLVHRDLKPDNILIGGPQSAHPGVVKILDFGLAKTASEPKADGATDTVGLSDAGTAVGTIAYMSPEQARGNANLTIQSDQFSFGLILYELTAGQRAFVRPSAAETMTAIIREEAEPLPASVPVQLRWVIERLLAKDPGERYDSTRDLYRELKQIRERYSGATSAQQIPLVKPASPVPAMKRRALSGAGLAAAGLVAGLGLAMLLIRPQPADLSAYKFTPIAREEGTKIHPAWSPDGKSIAYVSGVRGINQVFTRTLGSLDAAQLTNAAGNCSFPFWSPDGTTVYYSIRGDLWAVGASGGTPELVKEKAGMPALHPDGKTLAFGRDAKAWIGAIRGAEAREFWTSPHPPVSWRKFSPDGSKLAVIDAGDLWIVPYPTGTPRSLGGPPLLGASWLPDSRHLIVCADSTDALILLDTTSGNRRVIYRGTGVMVFPSVSPDGSRIAYSGGSVEWNVLEVSLADGRTRTLVGGGGISTLPDWAPSGTHYSFTLSLSGPKNFFVEDRSATDGFSRRLAESPPRSDSLGAFAADWSPDGTRFLFVQGPAQRLQLTIGNASGGPWTALAGLSGNYFGAHAWSPDGQSIAWVSWEAGKPQLLKMKPVAGATPVVLAKAAPALGWFDAIRWSPTGEWIAYPSAEGLSLISPDGNTVRKLTTRSPLAHGFSKSGAEVYGIFRNTTGEGAPWQLYSIDVKTGAEKLLAPLDLPASTDSITGFSLHPDGKRFLTSTAKWPYDIWMLEGFAQPAPKTWLGRLLQH